MDLSIIWIILISIGIILALVYFGRGKNAIWGGITFGLILGIVLAIIKPGFSWETVLKTVVLSEIITFSFEMLGVLVNKLKNR